MIYGNYHTHTTFCDGKNTVEEMTRAAIQTGLKELGFSGHAYMSFDESFCMSRKRTLQYRTEIARVKKKYAAQISIYCGVEQDIFSEPADCNYDYMLGSAHYIEYDGQRFCVDESAEQAITNVKYYFGGDWYRYCAAYYEQVARIPEMTGSKFLAHFDLVTKFNEGGALFDENDRRYRHAAMEVMEQLCEKNIVLEVNTGAMSRGYRTIPYPSEYLLKEAALRNIPVILNSDAHAAENLTYGFDHAVALVRKCGNHQIVCMRELEEYPG